MKEQNFKNEEGREDLIEYIVKLLNENTDKKKIRDNLLEVGWSGDDIDVAYGKALVRCGVPVPLSAKKATFTKKPSGLEIAANLFSFLLLAILTISLGTLLFQVVNRFFPDNISLDSIYRQRSRTASIHYAIAALIVGFPVYLFSIRVWLRGFRSEEGKTELSINKLLTYIVLLVTSVVILGNLITILFRFLQGGITIGFFLKAFIILLIAGIIFSFYFFERRKVQYKKDVSEGFFWKFGAGVASLILISVVLGFFATGSPALERKRKMDEQRADHLRSLVTCIEDYSYENQKLPDNLKELQQGSFLYCSNKKDPESGQDYDYRIITESKIAKNNNEEGVFELCANFELQSEGELNSYRLEDDKWSIHKAGRDCKQETVILRERKSNNQINYK